MNILVVLCEGAHDVAFLTRLLTKAANYKQNQDSINKYPSYLQSYFLAQIENHEYKENNLFSRPKLPTVLQNDKIMLLLYPVGGIDKIEDYKILIEDFNDLACAQTMSDIKLGLSFIIDADENGKKAAEKFNTRYATLLNECIKFVTKDLYIFANDKDEGALEDIILPLMRENDNQIFEAAEAYAKMHYNKKRSKSNKYNALKATINIAGQLQYSGVANADIIRQCDYITKEKIQKNAKCQEILAYFADLINQF
jgi:hypothetical protein